MVAEVSRSPSTGAKVGLGLGGLTIVEYALAIAEVPGLLLILAALAVAKGSLIVRHFMHIGQLRREAH